MLPSIWSSNNDRELSELRRNHRSAISRLEEVKQQKDQIDAEKTRAQQESGVLKAEITALELELQACKAELLACRDDLFRLQPTNHIPDSKIAGQFKDLAEGISTWIDAEISRYSDDWQKQHCPDVAPKLFSHGGDQWMGELLGKYSETAGEHLIKCMVQRQLCKTILNETIYLFGLDTDEHVLRLVEREMQQLKPPRGK